jgi:translocator protein
MSVTSQRIMPILVAALAAIAVGAIGSTITDLGPWYQNLAKPSWQPPDWLFGPAWTLIFALTALSAATAWNEARTRETREWIVIFFALNGFLNVFWSLLFFRLRHPDWALVEVGLLWLSILLLIISLARVSRTASLLLVPYLAWVSFAGLLNWQVVALNRPF